MAFRLVFIAALVAVASAGVSWELLEMMAKLQNQHQPEPPKAEPEKPSPCSHGQCQIPEGQDVGAYIEQQKQEQKFKSEQMAAQIKEKFEKVMGEVAEKRAAYGIGVMIEIKEICNCMVHNSDLLKANFLESESPLSGVSKYLGKEPKDSGSLAEARKIIFVNMVKKMCDGLLNFSDRMASVEDEIKKLETPSN